MPAATHATKVTHETNVGWRRDARVATWIGGGTMNTYDNQTWIGRHKILSALFLVLVFAAGAAAGAALLRRSYWFGKPFGRS